MLMAVYLLSPVSIQTLMPACLNASIVYFTRSCSLSYIAVAPTKYKSFSMAYYS